MGRKFFFELNDPRTEREADTILKILNHLIKTSKHRCGEIGLTNVGPDKKFFVVFDNTQAADMFERGLRTCQVTYRRFNRQPAELILIDAAIFEQMVASASAFMARLRDHMSPN